jgi:transthyretin-like family protein
MWFWTVLIPIAMVGTSLSAAPVTISGQVQYRGRTAAGAYGNFPAREVQVQLWDWDYEDTDEDRLFASTWTDDNGNYSITVDNQERNPGGTGTADIYVAISPASLPATGPSRRSRVSVVKYSDGTHYRWENSNVWVDASTNQTLNHTFLGDTALDWSFSVFDAALTQARWNDLQTFGHNDAVRVRFGGATGSYYYPGDNNGTNDTIDETDNTIYLVDGDRFDWDVVGEEYNHYMQAEYGYDTGVGGSHYSDINLRYQPFVADPDHRNPVDFRGASRLAFNEGVAQFGSIAGQVIQNAAAMGIQHAGDTSFADNADGDGISPGRNTSLETIDALKSLGEDNEVSVRRILWDLADPIDAGEHDHIALGYKELMTKIQADKPKTLTEFWDKAAATLGNQDKARYGAIFQEHGVAPIPDTASVSGIIDLAAAPGLPLFTWASPKGSKHDGTAFDTLDTFDLKILDSSFNDITPAGHSGLQTTSDTLAQEAWDILLADYFAQDLYWVVLGGNKDWDTTAANFETGMYWSSATSFALIPEPVTSVLLVSGIVLAWRPRRR